MSTEFQAMPQTPEQQLMVPHKSLKDHLKENKTGFIISGIVVILIIGMSAYLVSPQKNTLVAPATQEPQTNNLLIPTRPPFPTIAIPPQSPTPIATQSANSPWLLYSNTTYGYTINYPPDWTVQDLGELEPKIPSYIAFQPSTASSSSRLITISISTRTYAEQLTFGASSSAVTVASIAGTKQFFQDSDGQQSTAVILPRSGNLLILRAKSEYLTIFDQMLSTLTSQ